MVVNEKYYFKQCLTARPKHNNVKTIKIIIKFRKDTSDKWSVRCVAYLAGLKGFSELVRVSK